MFSCWYRSVLTQWTISTGSQKLFSKEGSAPCLVRWRLSTGHLNYTNTFSRHSGQNRAEATALLSAHVWFTALQWEGHWLYTCSSVSTCPGKPSVWTWTRRHRTDVHMPDVHLRAASSCLQKEEKGNPRSLVSCVLMMTFPSCPPLLLLPPSLFLIHPPSLLLSLL